MSHVQSRRLVLLLTLLLSLISCSVVAQTQPANKPSANNSKPSADIKNGKLSSDISNEFFSVISGSKIVFNDGVKVTEGSDTDGNVVYMINNGVSGGITCKCDKGCSYACESSMGPHDATCKGDCSGLSDEGAVCSICTFHYTRPATERVLRH